MAANPPHPQLVSLPESQGKWRLELHQGQAYTWVPEKQDGPVCLTPEAEEKLKEKYLAWCAGQGGGDCLGLLDDGPFLQTDDRRALALALAFGSVLDETREALTHELLDVRALIGMVVWTVALYGMQRWVAASLKGCRFKGCFSGCDFGHWPE